ncbi:MAG: aminoacyl-histidine dipeptidase [Spirochaetales bacterium]|nr:aminoacyl-histidine dipeptidase [Spirochaetales bacterium]
MSKEAIKGLEPTAVWEQFYQINQIPRESGNEAALREYILSWAKKLGISARTDKIGNVILRKPATPGFENLPTVILQGHLDMVCEKNRGTVHDFAVDPIKLVRDGDWIHAGGTTLGADNGIAVAMAMVIFEDHAIEHGPLEALFTIDEETGLVGAMNLEASLLEGKILINLDTEEEDTLCIGCAGGVNTEGELPVKREAVPAGYEAYQLVVNGLQGGHSGTEIHRGLGSALLMAMRILKYIGAATDTRLAALEGGGKHNAIPRECFVDLLIPAVDLEKVKAIVEENRLGFTTDYADIEPDLSITLNKMDTAPDSVIDRDSFIRLVDMVYAMPHGVIEMSRVMDDLVESSTNLAAVDLREDHLYVLTSQRASSNFLRDDIRDRIMSCFTAAGGTASQNNIYPGWKPNLNSPILETAREAYVRVMGKDPRIEAIHAGLECGVIGDKIPGIDMISLGPDIRMAHTPEEKMSISSLERIWKLVLEMLKAV